MTVLYLQTRPLREEASLAFLRKLSRGRRCACLAVFLGSTREEVGGSETGFIKRRHPGGGGCRHLIVGPQPREEVKRWASAGSILDREECRIRIFLGAVGGLMCDLMN